MKTTLKNIILLAAVAALSACGNSNKEPKETEFKLMCDESVENIIRQEVQVYELKYPDVRIHAHYVDEKAIDDSIMNLTRGVYITATEMTYERRRFLEANHRNTYCVPVAVDAIAVITHTGNDIAELSIQQLSDILTGKTKNWNEISPSKLGDISVVFDNQNSSTVKYMMQNVTNRKPFCKNVYAQKTNKDVFEMVRTHKNAIGIIGVSWLSRDLNNIAIVANYSKSELNEMEKRLALRLQAVSIRHLHRQLSSVPHHLCRVHQPDEQQTARILPFHNEHPWTESDTQHRRNASQRAAATRRSNRKLEINFK